MSLPNNQQAPPNPGVQQPQRPVPLNRAPFNNQMMQPGVRPSPPPFANQQSPMIRPGFRPPVQPNQQVPSQPLQQTMQRPPQQAFRPPHQQGLPHQQPTQQSPLPPAQPQLQQASPASVASVESQFSNMNLNSPAPYKPGKSRRVYAPIGNTPVSSNASPQSNFSPQTPQSNFVPQTPQPMSQQQPNFAPQQPVQQQANFAPQTPQQPGQSYQQQQQQQQQPHVNRTPLGLPPRSNAKPRIDPNQIPSPVQIQLKDEAAYNQPDYYYGTCNVNESLPLASTNFKTLDQGNCNPRFMRSTLQSIPQTYDLVNDTSLPFGLVLQPLALTHADDAAIPFVPLKPSGLLRCNRCKAYINPWCKFINGGKKYVCNLCNFENAVPEEEFCPCDMSGRRMDIEQRPELMFGSVEFEVPEEYYMDVEPKPLHWLCMIDVSRNAVQSGMVKAVCAAVKNMVQNGLQAGLKVGIVTFDTTVHFYNLHAGLDQPSIMVVSDINDVFVPLSEGLFVDPRESESVILKLLDQLPTLYENNLAPTAVFGSAVQAALTALTSIGGKVTVLQSSLPSVGPGSALKNRDDPKLYGTEREKGLFTPQDNFYTQLASQYVHAGVSLDLWLFPPPNAYVDVATLGALSAMTGGDTHYYPNFNIARENTQFSHNLTHSIYREHGYRASLRVRCSNGLSVEDHYGNFTMNNATDIELAGVHADTSIAVALKHDNKLPENLPAYFQCAVLYTTAQGQRRVRVHNLSLGVSSTASTVFKLADLDTSMNFLIKKNITLSAKKSLNDLSNQLDTLCVKILTSYRKHCASNASPAQLILPESFKNLPILFSSFKKSVVLRKDPSVNIDTRVYNLRKIKSLSIPGTIQWLYPRCIKLHEWLADPSAAQVPLERASYDRLLPEGIYWIESHHAIFLWIGEAAPAELVTSIFGTSNFNEINPFMNQLPEIPSNRRLRDLYFERTAHTPYLPQLNVIRHGMDLEVELSKVLIEDEVFGYMSYVDYLCMIHKQIQTELEREKQDGVVSSGAYWVHRY